MLAGRLYDPSDPDLVRERQHCRKLCRLLNGSREDEVDERRRILSDLVGQRCDATIHPPFHCDYGYNIALGDNVYFNFNCVVLDVVRVEIGSNVLIGPSVQIYTATHPIKAEERRTGLEYGRPVSIGDDVWIGGGSIICPGVKIGARSTIGAGSVVTRDVPSDVVAAGNPCRTIRHLARDE